jgi:hypothetical protein
LFTLGAEPLVVIVETFFFREFKETILKRHGLASSLFWGNRNRKVHQAIKFSGLESTDQALES